MMSSHSQQISSPLSGRAEQLPMARARGVERDGGSGSESDWTGTGDDWTGASSDSAFINFIRSQHQLHHSSHSSPRMSPVPSTSGEGIYTGLSPNTMNQDNQYCSVDRLHPVAPHSPTPNRGNTTPLDSVAELGESLTEEDEYCKMVPNASIRADLMKKAEPPLSPLAVRRPLPQVPLHSNSSDPAMLPPHRQLATMRTSPSEPALMRPDLSSPSRTPYRHPVLAQGRSHSVESSPYRHPVPVQARNNSLDIRYNM